MAFRSVVPNAARSVALALCVAWASHAPLVHAQLSTPDAGAPAPGGVDAPAAVPNEAAPTAPSAPASDPDADTDEKARARALFTEGVRLADERRWAEAAERFEGVLAMRWSSAAAYNLGGALRELGRLVDSSERYRQVLRDPDAAPAMHKEAKRALADVEQQLGKLNVAVRGDTTGITVYLDDRAMPPDSWNVPVPVDPGTHRVTAVRGGEAVASEGIIIGGGGGPLSLAIVLEVPPVGTPGTGGPVPTPAQTAQAGYAPAADAGVAAPSKPITDQWWFWTGAGLIVTSTIAIILVAALSGDDAHDNLRGDLDPGVLRGRVEE